MKKFGICIESNHQKGLGHLIRALNLIEFLNSKRQDYVLIINNDSASIAFLKTLGINFAVAPINDLTDNWETALIKKHKINVWVNDRLDTALEHARNVKLNEAVLISLDDRGNGAELSDINFGSLPLSFNYDLKGKKTFKGLQFLILDKKIDKYKWIRKERNRILVALGGSDTYGVTIKVVKILKELGFPATIVTGPLFKDQAELNKVIDERFIVKRAVPSLIKEFADYDLAITGGGITPFEANASGLPCIVIANELFEVANGEFLNKLGSSVYAGYHQAIKREVFTRDLDIGRMSRLGMEQIKTSGVENMCQEIDFLYPGATSNTSIA